jgi:hypothetical protein
MSSPPAPEEQVRIMNQKTETFLEELKQKPEVLGVILFGSWARGNNRPDSCSDSQSKQPGTAIKPISGPD